MLQDFGVSEINYGIKIQLFFVRKLLKQIIFIF